MNRILFFFLLFVLLNCPAAVPLSPVWFQHISQPLPLQTEQGEQYAARLRQMLLNNKTDEEIIAAFPDDPHPRILFIALGDGEWPERIAMDTGETFRLALKNTLTTLRRREKNYTGHIQQQQKMLEEQDGGKKSPLSASWQRKLKNPNRWNALRLTIVQQSRQYEQFSISLSKILLANLNGIAFPRSAGFAFPPEQMTGRYLLTADHFFDSNQIGNILSESENFHSMSSWLQLTTAAPPFPVILFDCVSFYADEQSASRLFRCHTIPKPQTTPDRLLAMATACGRKLLPQIRKNGNFASPFPEWIASLPEGEHPASLSELSITFSRLSAAAKDPKFAEAAAKINRGLVNLIKKYKVSGNRHRCLIEKEILENADDPQEPRRIASTRTNAMACLAFLEYCRCTGSREFMEYAEMLIDHLCNVQQNSGRFSPLFVHPTMQPPAENYFTDSSRLELDAVAALAMLRYQELTDAHPEFSLRQRILRCRNRIYGICSKNQNLAALPLSGWITEFLTAVNHGDLKPLQLLIGKIAIAAGLRLETDPVLPDLFGSVKDSAGMTVTAERTWLTAAATASLFRNGEKDQAKFILSDCWIQLMFQLQASMDQGTASALPQPCRYYDYFRDNLDTFSFNLDGQVCQLLSLLTLHQTLTDMKLELLSPPPESAAQWHKNWSGISRSPFLLTPDLIITKGRTPDTVRRISGNIQGVHTTTRVQTHSGKIIGTSRNPTGTVLQRKEPQGNTRKRNFLFPAP